jgi:hypothetical protein
VLWRRGSNAGVSATELDVTFACTSDGTVVVACCEPCRQIISMGQTLNSARSHDLYTHRRNDVLRIRGSVRRITSGCSRLRTICPAAVLSGQPRVVTTPPPLAYTSTTRVDPPPR